MNPGSEKQILIAVKYFLGIDGGGTSTRAVFVSDAGRVLGNGESGPSNYHNVGMVKAIAHIEEAARNARPTGLPRSPDAVFLGCAGIKSAVDIARLTSAAETAGIGPTGEITAANDLHNALTGGLAGAAGIALIAGTGTNCLGRNSVGATFMCGGWGWLLDDVGGGCGIALAAMRAAVRAADRRSPKTRLLAAVLAFLGLSEPNEILARLYVEKWTAADLGAFAPVVMRLASEGDTIARRILEEGAASLAGLVAATAQELDFPGGPSVVMLGGCALSGAPYQPMVEAAILSAVPKVRIVPAVYSPTHGAALNALRAGGIDPLPKLQIQ